MSAGPFLIDFIQKVTGSAPISRPSIQGFGRLETDSRRIQEGDLFVALQGENFDGHDFIQTAFEKGAKGVICAATFSGEIPPKMARFSVPDTLMAYRQISAAWRQKFKIPVIAIAGSVGKTTTKELVASLLTGKWPDILKTEGSQNGFVGIPMTLLKLREHHQAAVVEIGIDEIGAMAKHLQVVKPTLSTVTAIGPEHLEKLKDLPTVAEEETLALRWVAEQGGITVFNLNDEWIHSSMRKATRGKRVAVRFEAPEETEKSAPIDRELKLIQGQLNGKILELRGLGEGVDFQIPLPGKHNVKNFMVAIGVGAGLGLSVSEMKKGLSAFKTAPGRTEIHQLSNGVQVLADHYNANPTSVEAAIDLLTQMASGSPRWVCLGDMLELGVDEERFHRNLSKKIIEQKIENVLLFGPLMAHLQEELSQRQFSGKVVHFKTREDLAATLQNGLESSHFVLIKGSGGMKMEIVLHALQKQE